MSTPIWRKEIRVPFVFAAAALGVIIGTFATAQDADKAPPDLSKDKIVDGFPASLQPWRDPDDPLVQRINKDWDFYFTRRDRSNDPKREPGPISLQRYAAVSGINGFPTFMGLPVALSKEDLVAGKVDVAYVGLPSGFQPTGGTQWAANQMRMIRSYDHGESGHDMHLNIDYFDVLKVVDYGNGNQNPVMMMRNFADQALLLRDVLQAGAIPLVMGGDHGTQVASLMALVDHYGPQSFAVVHFDAHFDYEDPGKTFGQFTHGARARRYAHEQGWVKGEDLHSIGTRSPYHSRKLLEWVRKIGDRYHYMAEFEKSGFEKVWGRIKNELKGKKLYISVDIDVLDTAHVPGTSNPEPGGLNAIQMLTMLRGLAIQNEVILIDFCEYTPLLDDRHYNTALMINRMMRAFLAGTAARKQGITDPDYIAPGILDHGRDEK
ncbi:MAG: arginase family protein [Planctomycetota bacterium]